MTNNAPRRNRKSPRLPGYDYAQTGGYFVTICAHGQMALFGAVVGGELQLNAAGEVAARCWSAIPAHFLRVELDAFVVMPNHVHGIIIIHTAESKTDDSLPNRAHGVTPGSLGAVVASYKSAVTREIRKLQPDIERVWQERYYDHIIRNDMDLMRIREYIVNNPGRWEEDSLYNVK